jgi:hypothetical protein
VANDSAKRVPGNRPSWRPTSRLKSLSVLDNITRQSHASQMFVLLTRQTPKHLGAGERRVHEQAYHSISPVSPEYLSKQSRDKQQVVIVHPDKISGTINLRDAICESTVGCLVGWVVRIGRGILGSNILPKEVMEEWPKN